MKGIVLAGGSARVYIRSPGRLQAAAAYLRQADDFLPGVRPDAGGYSRHPDHLTPDDMPSFQRPLGDGSQFGVNFMPSSRRRDGWRRPLSLARSLSATMPAPVLGIISTLARALVKLEAAAAKTSGATVFGYRVLIRSASGWWSSTRTLRHCPSRRNR